jgi:hypothetical protein
MVSIKLDEIDVEKQGVKNSGNAHTFVEHYLRNINGALFIIFKFFIADVELLAEAPAIQLLEHLCDVLAK